MTVVNPMRSEVALVINGDRRVMRLTLGALAELEAALEAASLVELAERFERGSVSANELVALLGAGLRGGGLAIDDEALRAAEIEGGALGAMRTGMALLAATFPA